MLRLCADRVHHAHRVNDPKERGLPVHAFQNALERLISGHLIRQLLAAHPRDWVAEERIPPSHAKFHCVSNCHCTPP